MVTSGGPGHPVNTPDAALMPASLDWWLRTDLTHPDGRQFHVYGEPHGTLEHQSADTGYDVGSLHRRFDRLTGAWVLVSPARNRRPGGLGRVEGSPVCPLCPGGPELPWHYDVAVFDNRFPSLTTAPAPLVGTDATLRTTSIGRCQVVVYTPDHDGSLASLSPHQLVRVMAVWRDRSAALWAEGHRCVMAFENRGEAVGATLAHPHGQFYAFAHLPPVTVAKVAAHGAHRVAHDECLGCRLAADDTRSERVIFANASFVVAVPFAARWPFEVHLRSRRHGLGRLSQLTDSEVRDLAAAIRATVLRLDGLFGFAMPLMLAVQEAPTLNDGSTGGAEPDWHLHVEVVPPHRSAERLKVRASVETALGQFINDTLPEESAALLAAVDVEEVEFGSISVPRIESKSGIDAHCSD